jgi:hypothetical protein
MPQIGSSSLLRPAPLHLGLLDGDDVDALTCAGVPQGGRGDANCDGGTDSIDAVLVLQHNAGLLDALGCNEDADVNGDGAINSVDATLILQFTARLIDWLPVA